MLDSIASRVSRELFFSSMGGNLASLEPWVADRLTAILEEEDVAAGEAIFAAGDPAEYLHFVRQGRVELRSKDRRETIVGPRSVGMFDVLAERPRASSAVALTQLQLLRIRADAWFDLLEDSFEVARGVVLALTRTVATRERGLWTSGRPPAAVSSLSAGSSGRELDPVERLVTLMQAPILRRAGAQPLADLASACEEVTFSPGDVLVRPDSGRNLVFVLIEGRAEAVTESPGVVWRGGPGEMVGGVASLTEAAARWEVRGQTHGRALVFGVDDWLDVLEEHFEMTRATLGTLVDLHERFPEPGR